MRIEPGRGLDDILFGIDAELLADQIGAPDKKDSDPDGCPLYIYYDMKCTFWFDEADRLHWIQCANLDALLLGETVIGADIQPILQMLSRKLKEHFTTEDYGSIESHSFEDSEIEIQSIYGTVDQVCFGHFWKNDDEPIYPAI